MSNYKIKIKHVGNKEYEIYVNKEYAGSVEVKPNIITAYYAVVEDGEVRIKHTMTDDFDVATSIVVGKHVKNH